MPYFVDKNKATAITVLTNLKGDIIFDFMTGYQIFPDKLFDRIFTKHSKSTEKLHYSPYREEFKFKDITINQNTLKATLPKMKVEQCAGHFDNYPILPVGVLSYMAINTVGYFLNNITKNHNLRYHLSSAEMNVFIPTSIDEESELIVNYSKCENNEYYFSWVMRDNSLDKILNTMNISFSISHEIFNIETKDKIYAKLAELDQYKKMYSELAYQLYNIQNAQNQC